MLDTVTCGMAETHQHCDDSDVKSRFCALLTLTVHAILLQLIAVKTSTCTVTHTQL